jgi:hypothetical protein
MMNGTLPPDSAILLSSLNEILHDWRVAPEPLRTPDPAGLTLRVGAFGMGSSGYDPSTVGRPAQDVFALLVGKLGAWPLVSRKKKNGARKSADDVRDEKEEKEVRCGADDDGGEGDNEKSSASCACEGSEGDGKGRKNGGSDDAVAGCCPSGNNGTDDSAAAAAGCCSSNDSNGVPKNATPGGGEEEEDIDCTGPMHLYIIIMKLLLLLSSLSNSSTAEPMEGPSSDTLVFFLSQYPIELDCSQLSSFSSLLSAESFLP